MPSKHALHKLAMSLGNNPRLAFSRLIQGGLLFVFGCLVLILADRVISPSQTQEIIAIFGIGIAAIGIGWTTVGYLSLSVLRIYHMINKQD